MKGIIICGFPGIGKSSVAGWNRCIDLESSRFSQINQEDSLLKIEWAKLYCDLAVDLANQGFTVLTSTHKSVTDIFCSMDRNQKWPENVAGAVVFCPEGRMRAEWIERLYQRFCQDGTNENNWRAYDRVRHDWSMVFNLINCGLPVYQPAAMDYDLRNYIYYIRETRCGGNYEHVPNGDPSLETMDGVEETGLEVRTDQENHDISWNQL